MFTCQDRVYYIAWSDDQPANLVGNMTTHVRVAGTLSLLCIALIRRVRSIICGIVVFYHKDCDIICGYPGAAPRAWRVLVGLMRHRPLTLTQRE